ALAHAPAGPLLIGAAWLGLAAAAARTLHISWANLLVLLALAYALGLGIIQGRARYVTSYGYGESGRAEVLGWAESNAVRGSALLSPPNLQAELQGLGFRGAGHGVWRSREDVLGHLRREAPSAVVLSATENAAWQLRWLLHEPPDELAACREGFRRIGSFWVCRLPRRQGPAR
ncbi:MAG: hypothetical protein AABZ64_01720, partial [Nitrospinota bacterium]